VTRRDVNTDLPYAFTLELYPKHKSQIPGSLLSSQHWTFALKTFHDASREPCIVEEQIATQAASTALVTLAIIPMSQASFRQKFRAERTRDLGAVGG
jgi:hypothetical protein